MSDIILLGCPKCGRKIGIPKASGTVHITCPKCREQWDWPRRKAPAKGGAAQRAGWGFSKVGGWMRRAAFGPPRFSSLQLSAAVAAGIGIGLVAGIHFGSQGGSDSAEQTENAALSPGHGTNDLAAASLTNRPGTNSKIDESILSSLPDAGEEKAKRPAEP